MKILVLFASIILVQSFAFSGTYKVSCIIMTEDDRKNRPNIPIEPKTFELQDYAETRKNEKKFKANEVMIPINKTTNMVVLKGRLIAIVASNSKPEQLTQISSDTNKLIVNSPDDDITVCQLEAKAVAK